MKQLHDSLEPIYGTGGEQQLVRYREAVASFRAQYGSGEITIFRALGRVNLIGEHTDYNHGYVLSVALDKYLLLLARPRRDQTIRLRNIETKYQAVEITISTEIPRAPAGDWSNYICDTTQASAMSKFGQPLMGP